MELILCDIITQRPTYFKTSQKAKSKKSLAKLNTNRQSANLDSSMAEYNLENPCQSQLPKIKQKTYHTQRNSVDWQNHKPGGPIINSQDKSSLQEYQATQVSNAPAAQDSFKAFSRRGSDNPASLNQDSPTSSRFNGRSNDQSFKSAKKQFPALQKANKYTTIGSSTLATNTMPTSFSYDYNQQEEQEAVGPGYYEGSKWSHFDIIASKKMSKIHKSKPVFSFGKGLRNNSKQYISKQHWISENMLQQSVPVGTYDPKIDITRDSYLVDCHLESNSTRFDEYGAKKQSEMSPGYDHDVIDPKHVAYTDKFRTYTSTFGKGNRFLQKKVEKKPAPGDHNLQSVFEINSQKAPLLGRPRMSYVEQIWNKSIDRNKETRNNMHQKYQSLGPGAYNDIQQGKLSQSQSQKLFAFGKDERRFANPKCDPTIKVGPGQYMENILADKDAIGERDIIIGAKPKCFDIKKYDSRLQAERVRNQRAYF